MVSSDILKRFSCSGCGECCRWPGSVVLTEQDIAVLSDHLEMESVAFIARHTRLAPNRKHLALLDQQDGSCAFLQGDQCSIYAARPEQCRTFPFAWHVAEGCPELDKLLAEEKNIEQTAGNP